MEYLFVYGVFRDYGKAYLKKPVFCGKATIPGKMYKVNEFYPGYIPQTKGKIVGDVYIVDPMIFDDLDEFEGSEYIRTKVRTSTDVECWVYQYINDVSDFEEIECGDWLLR